MTNNCPTKLTELILVLEKAASELLNKISLSEFSIKNFNLLCITRRT